MNPWRAGCGESRTSGSEGGPGKPAGRDAGKAPRSDPYTKLRGPQKWSYYYLYVIMDVYSRYVVGWMIALREQATLAKELIETTCQRQGIAHDQLIIHSDRGPSMTSKTVAQLMADLGVEKSHSRPYVSNDNPYSEAQFFGDEVSPGLSRSVWLCRGCPAVGAVHDRGTTKNTIILDWR